MSGVGEAPALPPAPRRIFCNRTLNMRSVRAIGYDMDYTLVHYQVEAWERRAFAHLQTKLADMGWPVEGLSFDPQLFLRGLILDLELGHIVKANRFGYVKKAFHGTRALDFEAQRRAYSRCMVDTESGDGRWVALHTLFSLSEASMFAQLVELVDAGRLPPGTSYRDIYTGLKRALDEAHMEGALKAEIVADPDRFVVPDPELVLTLQDQRAAGKKVLLITNSEWEYTQAMMRIVVESYLGKGERWRELFDLVIVGARKPSFFSAVQPAFAVADEAEGTLRPQVGPLEEGGAYVGGHARLVEECLGLPGEEILYVGDHIHSDVRVSKGVLRWRTALVLRELEQEIEAVESFRESQAALSALMREKSTLEHALDNTRLKVLRLKRGYGADESETREQLQGQAQSLRAEISALDERIAPLAVAAGQLHNSTWGLLMRAGKDKSHLARQIEASADIYTSRVSNLMLATPFAFLRAPGGSLPHQPGPHADARTPLDPSV